MKQTKPFLDYEQQIDFLASKKGLIINYPEKAINDLKNIGYYSLIDGYKEIFYDGSSSKYISGTKFEDILSLYYFDEELRILFFKYLSHVEQRLCSLISYSFSQHYSPYKASYLNKNNYNLTAKNQVGIENLISILKKEAEERNEHEYIVYQRKTYGDIPLWVLIKTLTFGQISKMYSFLGSNIKSQISKNYENVSEKQLGQFLKVLTDFRNVCAHKERLFSYNCRFEIPDTKIHQKLSIPKKGEQYLNGKKDLFSVVIAFKYLLSHEEFVAFKSSLSKILDNMLPSKKTVFTDKLIKKLGFPENWKSITSLKI